MTGPAVVLVVDDDAMVRDVLCAALDRVGFFATGCGTGEAALSLAREVSFDAFIIDQFLPGRTGTKTAQELRARFPGSFIIGFSGSYDGQDFAAAGADLFLSKPADAVCMAQYLRARLSPWNSLSRCEMPSSARH